MGTVPFPSAHARTQMLAEQSVDEDEANRAVEENRRLARLQPPANGIPPVTLAICIIDTIIQHASGIRRMLGAVENYARAMSANGEGDAEE